jgi:hypothetical protein
MESCVSMKKYFVLILATFLAISLLCSLTGAQAAQPKGYWPYFTAYQKAISTGNADDILSAGDRLLGFYAQFPMNADTASMSYNIYYYRYRHEIFENKCNYDAAADNAAKLASVSNYLGFTDMAIAAEARARKLDPMTEVYALSDNKDAAVYYGAKNEPKSGTAYGRVVDIVDDTRIANAGAISNESIVSVYVELGIHTAADYDWIIGPYDDGRHIVHLALNFPEQGATAPKISSGAFDANIAATLRYLETLKSPVLLRLGGEMNLWQMDPGAFKEAYLHIASLARSLAPGVALVWSPNYVGYWGSNVGDYYPGDSWVDWVGLSLYANSTPTAGHTADDDDSMYFGRGLFADCVLSMKEMSGFALSHRKPVIITEGGTGIIYNPGGIRHDEEAAAQITERYTALTMVYPNIKGIVYFDHDVDGEIHQYALSNSSAVASAYDAAVASNPTLVSRYGTNAPAYVKLRDFAGATDSVQLSAFGRTIYGKGMTVSYYLSGVKLQETGTLPYRYTLDISALAAGKHEFSAVFDDGAGYRITKTYTLTKLANGVAIFSEGWDGSAPDAPSAWAKDEAGLSLEANLVPEALQGTYTANITRLDFCRLAITLLERKTGKPIDSLLSEKGAALDYSAFVDTTDKNVLAAGALGIISGRGGGIFDGAAGITREEAAKMLANAAAVLGIRSTGSPPAFADAGTFSSWATPSISFVASTADTVTGKPVMGGVGANLFDPRGMYTYQQAYITMLRLYRA